MRKTYIFALLFLALAVVWLLSGVLQGKNEKVVAPSLADASEATQQGLADRQPTRVRGILSFASDRAESVRLRGQTRNKRTVTVRFETQGRVMTRAVELGDRVEEGDLLFALEPEDREARVTRSQDQLLQAELEYDGFLRLQDRGFQTETNIAAAKARLSQSQVNLVKDLEELERSNVVAPFDGSIEEVMAEESEWVQPGAPAVKLVDLDPMRIDFQVAEKDVHRLTEGMTAHAKLVSGELLTGEIVFVGKQSEISTRTFRVEVEVPNEDFAIRSGLTADIEIPLQQHRAHKLSSALLALDDAGVLGVRIVNEADLVEFKPVELIGEEKDGIWVTGLPDTATIITVGQEYVFDGEKVVVDYQEAVLDDWQDDQSRPSESPLSSGSGELELTARN